MIGAVPVLVNIQVSSAMVHTLLVYESSCVIVIATQP